MPRLIILFLIACIVFSLQLSIFQSIPLSLGFCIIILFFISEKYALFASFYFGFLTDLFSPIFGVGVSTYLLTFFILYLCMQFFITNRSYGAYALIYFLGYIFFTGIGYLIAFFFGLGFASENYQPFFNEAFFKNHLISFTVYFFIFSSAYRMLSGRFERV